MGAVTALKPGLTEALKSELRSKHGDALFVLEHMGVQVVCTPPSYAAWSRFRTRMFDERNSAKAMEELVTECVVHPDREAFRLQLERLPGLVETFGKALVKEAGSNAEAEKKAL